MYGCFLVCLICYLCFLTSESSQLAVANPEGPFHNDTMQKANKGTFLIDDGEICSLNVIVLFEPDIGLKLNSASLLLFRGYSNFSFVSSHLPTSRCSRVCVGGEIMCFCVEVQKGFFYYND